MKVAEVKLTYKTTVKASERVKIMSSDSAYKVLKPYFDDDMEYKELFYVIYLNRANKVLGVSKVSEGGCSGTVADGKIMFQGALLCNAQGMILAHNHPSGNLNPSNEDLKLTRRVAEAGKILDINLLDHVIITKDGYCSLADKGLI